MHLHEMVPCSFEGTFESSNHMRVQAKFRVLNQFNLKREYPWVLGLVAPNFTNNRFGRKNYRINSVVNWSFFFFDAKPTTMNDGRGRYNG